MNRPKITIITPTWKRPIEIIDRCIRSVNAQSFKDWEHIICSDGFEENVKTFVEQENEPRRIYKSLCKHEGIYANNVRQACLKISKGEYILFLDDDNIIFPHYLEKMIKALENTKENIGFSVCRIIHLGPLSSAHREPPTILTGIPVVVQNIDTLQVVVKKQALNSIGGWNTTQGYLADGYTFQDLAKKYEYIEVPEILGIHL